MMKKIIAIALVCLLLGLCGCGSNTPVPQTEATTVPTTEATAATEAASEAETTAAAEETSAEPENNAKDIAASLIDHPVEELIQAIGEPESSDYAPSCLKENAEDGNWYYDGFIVYTIRQGDQETVYYVE